MAKIDVAPLVGAWIEIAPHPSRLITIQSLPSWERGLKSGINTAVSNAVKVAPLVGAWIEIPEGNSPYTVVFVAPLVGAWIEIW